ncbi:MAG: AAA family ATPase, partial [Bryobacteraceae bacterium]
MMSFVNTKPAYCPPPPETMDALGIPPGLVQDLVVRRAYATGMTSLQELSSVLKISPIVLENLFRELRHQQLVEVKGMLGNDYSFCLTAAGRSLAVDRYQISHYAGAAPVSLKQYHKASKMQVAKIRIDRKSLRQAFSDMVLPDKLLDQLGPAA